MPERAIGPKVVGWLFLLGLSVQGLLFAISPQAGYPDSWYYTTAARELAAGHGFSIPYLWSYLETGAQVDPTGHLPLVAFGHWQPLAALIQLPFIALFGPTGLASAMPFIVLGALLAPVAALAAQGFGLSRRRAVLVGILAAVPGAFAWLLPRPDNFALFGLLVIGALWVLTRIWAGGARRRALIAFGLLAGLATLARPDGLLLPLLLGLLVGGDRILARRDQAVPRLALRSLGWSVLAFALVAGPWFAHQIGLFGAPFPAESGHLFYVRNLEEHWMANGPFDLAHLLGAGPLALIGTRVSGLVEAVALDGLYLGSVLLVPFILFGLPRLLRRSSAARIFAGFWLLHLAWAGLGFPLFIPNGLYAHGLLFALPLALAAGLEGAEPLTHWLLPFLFLRWAPTPGSPAYRRLASGLLVLAVVGNLCVFALLSTEQQGAAELRQARLDSALNALQAAGLPAGSRVMSSDPGALWIEGGYVGIFAPRGTPAPFAAAITAYHVQAVIVEADFLELVSWAAAPGSGLGPAIPLVDPLDGVTPWAELRLVQVGP
jgi:4-amino-4-deoxy-L-arabinose transferase-like glycosyltransferase